MLDGIDSLERSAVCSLPFHKRAATESAASFFNSDDLCPMTADIEGRFVVMELGCLSKKAVQAQEKVTKLKPMATALCRDFNF